MYTLLVFLVLSFWHGLIPTWWWRLLVWWGIVFAVFHESRAHPLAFEVAKDVARTFAGYVAPNTTEFIRAHNWTTVVEFNFSDCALNDTACLFDSLDTTLTVLIGESGVVAKGLLSGISHDGYGTFSGWAEKHGFHLLTATVRDAKPLVVNCVSATIDLVVFGLQTGVHAFAALGKWLDDAPK